MNNINTSTPQLNDVLNGLMKPENSNVAEKDQNISEKVDHKNLPVELKATNKAEPLSKVQMEELAVKLQEFVGDLDKSLKFETHQESGRDVVKVLDGESGDLIKQFPSEELLGIITNLSKASGLLVNEKI